MRYFLNGNAKDFLAKSAGGVDFVVFLKEMQRIPLQNPLEAPVFGCPLKEMQRIY